MKQKVDTKMPNLSKKHPIPKGYSNEKISRKYSSQPTISLKPSINTFKNINPEKNISIKNLLTLSLSITGLLGCQRSNLLYSWQQVPINFSLSKII